MYLHEVTVRNFSIHRETHVKLSPITVFVGPNGAGKSAFFDALLNFSMLARGSIGTAFSSYPYSFAATRHRGAASIARIGYEIRMSAAREDPDHLRYRIDYSQQEKAEGSPPTFHIHAERLESASPNGMLFHREDPDSSVLRAALPYLSGETGVLAAVRKAHAAGADSDFPRAVVHCAQQISRFSKFRLAPYKLALANPLPDLAGSDVPRLDYDGDKLAGTLYYMKETGVPALETIRDQLTRTLPGFEDFDFNIGGNQRIGFSIRFADQREAIPAARLSDGQLLLVGLMVLAYSPGRSPVLMVEEPENGLTPPAQRAFYNAVRELAFREDPSERSQVLISSHSPFIICEAWNGEDREFIHQVNVESGHAVIRPFSEAIAKQGIHLSKDKVGGRTRLGLSNAEDLMAGYLS